MPCDKKNKAGEHISGNKTTYQPEAAQYLTMKKYDVLMDLANYYHIERLNDLMTAINQGGKVCGYINCIGRTRAIIEGNRYREKIEEIYKDKITIEQDGLEFIYQLKK